MKTMKQDFRKAKTPQSRETVIGARLRTETLAREFKQLCAARGMTVNRVLNELVMAACQKARKHSNSGAAAD